MKHKLAKARARMVAEFAAAHPEVSYAEIGKMFNITKEWVSCIGAKAGVKRPRGMAAPSFPQEIKDVLHAGLPRYDHDRVITDLRKGKAHYAEIAKKHSVCYDTVAKLAQTNGLNPGAGHRAIVIPDLAKVIRYVISHPLVPQRVVADKLKVNRKTFGKIMRRNGVIRPVGRKGKRYED